MEIYNVLEETVTLPSLGNVYSPKINPNITLRSMNTLDEMKRLNSASKPYKAMCDMIDSCTTSKIELPAYEMCISDYQYLLHRLRVITYGSEYKMECTCPLCRRKFTAKMNLDELEVNTYDEEKIKRYSIFELPVSKKSVEITLQSPKLIDEVADKAEASRKKGNVDKSMIYTLMAIITKIDGVSVNPADKELFIQKLSMRDVNTIFQYSEKLNDAIGINSEVSVECEVCRYVYPTSFRITSEFFRPTLDI